METFQTLRISDKKVITNSNVGRKTFYKMKKGKPINADAYLRLTDYAVQVIRERKTKKLPLSVTEEELAKQLVLTFIG